MGRPLVCEHVTARPAGHVGGARGVGRVGGPRGVGRGWGDRAGGGLAMGADAPWASQGLCSLRGLVTAHCPAVPVPGHHGKPQGNAAR